VLTTEQKTFYETYGFLVFRQYFSKEETVEIRSAFDDILEEALGGHNVKAAASNVPRPSPSPNPTPRYQSIPSFGGDQPILLQPLQVPDQRKDQELTGRIRPASQARAEQRDELPGRPWGDGGLQFITERCLDSVGKSATLPQKLGDGWTSIDRIVTGEQGIDRHPLEALERRKISIQVAIGWGKSGIAGLRQNRVPER
jgi:hypothetical protein